MKGYVEMDRRIYDGGFFGKNLFWDFYCFSLWSFKQNLKGDHSDSLVYKPCVWVEGGGHLTSNTCLRSHNVKERPDEPISDDDDLRDDCISF